MGRSLKDSKERSINAVLTNEQKLDFAKNILFCIMEYVRKGNSTKIQIGLTTASVIAEMNDPMRLFDPKDSA